MADIFISYAREDRGRAHALADALADRGWSVWWDREIIAGQAFDQAIERELEAARSVVVLWSEAAVSSEWVKNEAAAAAERGVLVPALLAPVRLPLEFRRRQAADLSGWRGDPAHPGFAALCAGVAATIGGGAATAQAIPPPPPRRAKPRLLPAIGVLVALAALALAAGGWWFYSGLPAPPVPAERKPPAAAAGMPGAENVPASVSPLADLAAGSYFGAIVADAKGPSRSDVWVTVQRLDARTVRLTADAPRLGSVDVALDRIGSRLVNAGGDTPLVLDLDARPPRLDYTRAGEIAFSGVRQPDQTPAATGGRAD